MKQYFEEKEAVWKVKRLEFASHAWRISFQNRKNYKWKESFLVQHCNHSNLSIQLYYTELYFIKSRKALIMQKDYYISQKLGWVGFDKQEQE